MKPNIFICGPSGTGKSTSMRNLPPERTVILNTEQKALPFLVVQNPWAHPWSKKKYFEVFQKKHSWEGGTKVSMMVAILLKVIKHFWQTNIAFLNT